MSRVFRKTERKNKQTTLSVMREEKRKEEAEGEGEIKNKSNIKARREVK